MADVDLISTEDKMQLGCQFTDFRSCKAVLANNGLLFDHYLPTIKYRAILAQYFSRQNGYLPVFFLRTT
jgi:hypothetical protein